MVHRCDPSAQTRLNWKLIWFIRYAHLQVTETKVFKRLETFAETCIPLQSPHLTFVRLTAVCLSWMRPATVWKNLQPSSSSSSSSSLSLSRDFHVISNDQPASFGLLHRFWYRRNLPKTTKKQLKNRFGNAKTVTFFRQNFQRQLISFRHLATCQVFWQRAKFSTNR